MRLLVMVQLVVVLRESGGESVPSPRMALEMVGPHWDGGGWGLWLWISTGMQDNGILGNGTVLGGRNMGFGDGGILVGSQWDKV